MSEMLTPIEEFSAVIEGVRERFVPGLSRVAADHEVVAGSAHRWKPVTTAKGDPLRNRVREATTAPTAGRASSDEPDYGGMSLGEELAIRAGWVAEVEARGRDAEAARQRSNRAGPERAEQAFWHGVERLLEPIGLSAEQRNAQAVHDDGERALHAAQSAVLRAEREQTDSDWRGRLSR